MLTTSLSPEPEVAATWRAFLELVCSDEELVEAEFDAIVAAAWTSPPDATDVLSDQGRPRVNGPICPRAGLGAGRTISDPCWRRQRSPPPGEVPLAERLPPVATKAGGNRLFSAKVNEATMHTPSDPYAELEIPRDASQAEITHAFRRLLRRHHPDTRGTRDMTSGADSDSALQRVLAAYSTLREARATRDGRPEPAPPSSVSRQPGADAPIRAGPIYWTTGIGEQPQRRR